MSSRSSCSRIGPTIGPAMPLPPSSTTFNGRIRAGSMSSSARAWNSAYTSTSWTVPGVAAASPRPSSTRRRTSPIPLSPDSASAPRSTSFAPV